ncbi:hypothetical protein HL65_004461 [Salmonella enterica]|nr:hypothetical protein [Salmonella enterica]
MRTIAAGWRDTLVINVYQEAGNNDRARAFRVTLYKMDGAARLAVATVRANAMLNVLLKAFI